MDEEIAQGIKEIEKFQREIHWSIQKRKLKKKLKNTITKGAKGSAKAVQLGTWKLYTTLRNKHRIILAALKMVFGNIGAVVLTAFLLYYAVVWYPYIDLVYYIMGLITGSTRHDFIYNYLIPYGVFSAVIGVVFVVLYFTVWSYIFPKLYLVKRDGDTLPIGRAYFFSPETKIIYANLDTFLNILRPIKSLKEIHVSNVQSVSKGITSIGELRVHAEGLVHLYNNVYGFTDEYIPQYGIKRELIEQHTDEEQAFVEYRTSRSLRYNPEINKSKYKSTVILLPAAVFKKQYTAPEESYRGVLENLRNRINTFEEINEQALTDEDVQADLSQKIAPLLKEIYEYARMLEAHLPALKEKNDAFLDEMRQHNMILDKPYFDDNLNVRQIPIDVARDYVADVRAVLESAEYTGVIEE